MIHYSACADCRPERYPPCGVALCPKATVSPVAAPSASHRAPNGTSPVHLHQPCTCHRLWPYDAWRCGVASCWGYVPIPDSALGVLAKAKATL